jgi:GxxExxY protein
MSVDDLNQVTETIIGCAFRVGNALGSGFLEKVYENALAHECRKAGFTVQQQWGVAVLYDGVVVGEYFADLLINETIIVELKVARAIDEIHLAQCLNYLRATGLQVCLLFNFGVPKIQVKRIVNQLS